MITNQEILKRVVLAWDCCKNPQSHANPTQPNFILRSMSKCEITLFDLIKDLEANENINSTAVSAKNDKSGRLQETPLCSEVLGLQGRIEAKSGPLETTGTADNNFLHANATVLESQAETGNESKTTSTEA